MALNIENIIAEIKPIKAIEEEFGVTAAAPVAVATCLVLLTWSFQDSFDVELTAAGDKKSWRYQVVH